MAATETDLIAELIEWLESPEHHAKTAADFVEQLQIYHSDLQRRDAAEEAAFVSGHSAGASQAWNAMRNFVGMRAAQPARDRLGTLIQGAADAILAGSGDIESARTATKDACAELMRIVKQKEPK